jgi:hypothetical protein
LVGVAVNVTDVPEQTGLADAAIDTLTALVVEHVVKVRSLP